MEKTKIYEALHGVRGRPPIDLKALENLLVRFSQLIAENRWIQECDINPLFASPDAIIALDARVILTPPETELPRLSIRPYPMNYVKEWALKDSTPVTLRPIVPEDEPLVVAFHKELSENSVRQRFFAFLAYDDRVAHERLLRICFSDFDREIAIVAETLSESGPLIIGAGRLSRIPGSREAYLTLIIADAYQNLGLGTELVDHLIRIAKEEQLTLISADILNENTGMLAICKRAGFHLGEENEKQVIRAELEL